MKTISMIILAFNLIAAPVSAFEPDEFHLGFELGGSIEKAQEHARSRGWTLRNLSGAFSDDWSVEGANATIYMCDDEIDAVGREFAGGVDEFAIIADKLGWAMREPRTSVSTSMTDGVRLSYVNTTFKQHDGAGVSVQLASRDGRTSINTIIWGPPSGKCHG
ncbi:MAG: hypothetical protein ACK5MQ_16385 [Pikeienuella sp.]